MVTPWGLSDHKQVLALGVNFYSTPSHGGVKVNKAQNLKIHPAFRNENGWYEEDCEILKVIFFYPELFQQETRGLSRAAVLKSMEHWFMPQIEAYKASGGVWE